LEVASGQRPLPGDALKVIVRGADKRIRRIEQRRYRDATQRIRYTTRNVLNAISQSCLFIASPPT
jgi:hypothetical protein